MSDNPYAPPAPSPPVNSLSRRPIPQFVKWLSNVSLLVLTLIAGLYSLEMLQSSREGIQISKLLCISDIWTAELTSLIYLIFLWGAITSRALRLHVFEFVFAGGVALVTTIAVNVSWMMSDDPSLHGAYVGDSIVIFSSGFVGVGAIYRANANRKNRAKE